MRRILFRASRLDNKHIIIGSLIQHSEDGDVYIETYDSERVLVDKNTVSQFTGYYAKNHKPIFEGDTVEYTNVYGVHVKVTGKVIWDDDRYIIRIKDCEHLRDNQIELPRKDLSENYLTLIEYDAN